jgi:hypothetical protein
MTSELILPGKSPFMVAPRDIALLGRTERTDWCLSLMVPGKGWWIGGGLKVISSVAKDERAIAPIGAYIRAVAVLNLPFC